MKFQTILLTLLSLTFIVNVKCKKNRYIPPKILPPITQEGKNSFGCKLNGEIWVAYSECPAFSLDCGELFVSAGNALSNGFFNLTIRAGRWFDHTNTSLWIEGHQNISSTGDKSDSVKVHFQGDHYKNYESSNGIYHPGQVRKFEVTKFDTANKIISGMFDFTVYERSGDSLRITEGRFDLKFFVCKCSDD